MRSPSYPGEAPVTEPTRWADASPEGLGAASRLIATPPSIIALPPDVAMRVRANVLRMPPPPASGGGESIWAKNAASLKLGGIAVGAALFGAAVITAVTSAQQSGGVRVVVAPIQQPEADDTRLQGVDVRAATHRHDATIEAAHGVSPVSDLRERHASIRSEGSERQSLASAGASGQRTKVSNEADTTPADVTSRSRPGGDTEHERAKKETSIGAASSVTRLTPDEGDTSVALLQAKASSNVDPSAATLTKGAGPVREARASSGDGNSDAEVDLLPPAGSIERPVVRPQFRRVTAASRVSPRVELSNLEEETRLLEDARSKLGRTPDAALRLALEHQTRFRQGQLLEQRRMIHLEALLRLGRDDEAKKLAGTIGSSIYKARAHALLVRYGIGAIE